jgi:hypothetical protein
LPILVFLQLLTPALSASHMDCPREELDQVSKRGHTLASYLLAIREFARLDKQEFPNISDKTHYIAKQENGVWLVVAEHTVDASESLFIERSAAVHTDHTPVTIQKISMSHPDLEFFQRAAKARETVLHDAGAEYSKIEVAILPANNGQFYVYLLPAQTFSGRYLFGHDARYLVSADGAEVVSKRQMHKSLIATTASDGHRQVAAGVHTHVLSDDPEDSDVSYVLLRTPSVPEYIKTPGHSYIIQVDGTIVCQH